MLLCHYLFPVKLDVTKQIHYENTNLDSSMSKISALFCWKFVCSIEIE